MIIGYYIAKAPHGGKREFIVGLIGTELLTNIFEDFYEIKEKQWEEVHYFRLIPFLELLQWLTKEILDVHYFGGKRDTDTNATFKIFKWHISLFLEKDQFSHLNIFKNSAAPNHTNSDTYVFEGFRKR